jgi:hypothetical protein
MVSGEGAVGSTPSLLNLTELLLIRPKEDGVELNGRQWGGDEVQAWIGFPAAADLKALGEAQLDTAKPLYAAMLSRQAERLLAHLEVAH